MSINLGTVTSVVQSMLQSDATVSSFIVAPVERGTVINEDVNRCPWIGVYKGGQRYEPRVLGSINKWEATPSLKIILRESTVAHGTDVDDQMESHIQSVIDVIDADITLGSTVDMVNSINVEYMYSETDRKDMFFQTAIITLDLEVSA